jgi:DNA polymerase III subunit epsilon
MREIIFDTETTGLVAHYGHRIVEIGCVEMIDKKITGRIYHQYINPERDMPEQATRIHGLTNEFLIKHPPFKDIVSGFLEFISDNTLVAHNAPFDMRFVNHHLEELKLSTIPMSRVIDTIQIVRSMFPGTKMNLDSLCRKFNIDNASRKYHGALLDAELLAQVYINLQGGPQRRFIFESEEEVSSDKLYKKKRDFPVPDNELNEHQEYIKKFILT